MSFRPPVPQALTIAGPSGDLEMLLETPDAFTGERFGVICHPHPQHGGTMTNKVVHTLARTFNECGLATIRFNYRGVGKSAGTYDEGRGETEDALAVIDWARAQWPAPRPDARLWLAGFSFGGAVAFRAALRRDTARLVLVAPAIARAPDIEALPNCPALVVQGDQDEVIEPSLVFDWIKRLPQPPVLKVLAGAGHYFHGRLPDLRETVRNWIEELDREEG